MGVGCFTIVFKVDNERNNVEPIVMHRFVRNMSSMISKEHLFSLQMRYLTPEEQDSCNSIEQF